jgi:hypothetical protein
MGDMSNYRKDKRQSLGELLDSLGDISKKTQEELEMLVDGKGELMDKVMESLDIDRNKELDEHESKSLINSFLKLIKSFEQTNDLNDE